MNSIQPVFYAIFFLLGVCVHMFYRLRQEQREMMKIFEVLLKEKEDGQSD